MIKYYTIDGYYNLNMPLPVKEMGNDQLEVLNESEFEALKYSLRLNNNLSDILYDLRELYHEDEISYGSYEELAEILVNKKRFLVEVYERVDS